MKTTLAIGTHGEVVIPKPIRDELNLTKGSKIDLFYSDNVITFVPSISARTKMDDDFDRVRQSFLNDGVTAADMLAEGDLGPERI